jgi:hypothetical protein
MEKMEKFMKKIISLIVALAVIISMVSAVSATTDPNDITSWNFCGNEHCGDRIISLPNATLCYVCDSDDFPYETLKWRHTGIMPWKLCPEHTDGSFLYIEGTDSYKCEVCGDTANYNEPVEIEKEKIITQKVDGKNVFNGRIITRYEDDFSIADVLNILKYLAGMESEYDEVSFKPDINIGDVLDILKNLAGMSVTPLYSVDYYYFCEGYRIKIITKQVTREEAIEFFETYYPDGACYRKFDSYEEFMEAIAQLEADE